MADVFISASVSAVASLSCALSCTYGLSASVLGESSASANIGGGQNIQLSKVCADSSASLVLEKVNFSIAPEDVEIKSSASASLNKFVSLQTETVSVEASASLNLGGTFVLNPPPVYAESKASATFCSTYVGVCDVIRESLLLWGIEDPCLAVSWVKHRALADLNSALQILWSQNNAVDYWTRTTLELKFSTGQESLKLSDEIQSVLGTARIDSPERCSLSPLTTRGEFDNFFTYFLGGSSNVAATGTPLAYFIERLNQSADDPCKTIMHVAPKPSSATVIKLDVVLEAPHYNWCDFEQCSKIPIPHKYIESILMPIVRHRASSFHLFLKPERIELLDREYATAMGQLGVNDPLPGKEEADD